MAFRVLSTYRLQMRGDCFTFADAEDLLPYLDDLGVSHLYLSPILTAARGSTHGYDVTDPTTVSAELGGADGLARLSAAARSRGMGLIVDIVPNHVGVDYARTEQVVVGRAAARPGLGVRVVLRYRLGAGRAAESCCRYWVPTTTSPTSWSTGTCCGSATWPIPIAPGTGSGTGPEVHDRQHYRLIGWRNGICGYRRFFSITSLAGLRQEDRAVFDATHVEVKRWFDEGLVDGVRIDHPDGLSDPGRLSRRGCASSPGPRRGSSSRRSSPSTKHWNPRCRSRAPPVTTRCAKSAASSSIPPAPALDRPLRSTGVATTHCPSWPAA